MSCLLLPLQHPAPSLGSRLTLRVPVQAGWLRLCFLLHLLRSCSQQQCAVCKLSLLGLTFK